MCHGRKLERLLQCKYSRHGWLDRKMTGQPRGLCPFGDSVLLPVRALSHTNLFLLILLQPERTMVLLSIWEAHHAFSCLRVFAHAIPCAWKSYPSLPTFCLFNFYVSAQNHFLRHVLSVPQIKSGSLPIYPHGSLLFYSIINL